MQSFLKVQVLVISVLLNAIIFSMSADPKYELHQVKIKHYTPLQMVVPTINLLTLNQSEVLKMVQLNHLILKVNQRGHRHKLAYMMSSMLETSNDGLQRLKLMSWYIQCW